MACRLSGAKPLSKSVLNHVTTTLNDIQLKFGQNSENFMAEYALEIVPCKLDTTFVRRESSLGWHIHICIFQEGHHNNMMNMSYSNQSNHVRYAWHLTRSFIQALCFTYSLIAWFMGPTWGPSGSDRTQVGPMLAPRTLLSGLLSKHQLKKFSPSRPPWRNPNEKKNPVSVVIWASVHRSSQVSGLLLSWWRHQVETFSALLAICAGNSPVTGEFPAQRPVTRSFDVFFDLHPSKRLSKES